MAVDITNNLPSVDYADSSVDTEDRSIIKINSTSYNVFDNWSDLIQKYFGVDDNDNPYISTLKSSFFGYFNELASSEIKNAVYHKNFLYDEHFLNTAVLPESIYNFAKMYNVPIDTATPSTMFLRIYVAEDSLTSSTLIKEISKSSITNANANTLKVYTLTFDRNNTLFTVNNINFSLPYPIILTIQQISEADGSYSYGYTANYDTTAERFPMAEAAGRLPYLKVWKENINGQEYINIGFQVYQFVKKTSELTITTSNSNPDTLYHTISFDNQLSFFDAKYEFNGKVTDLNLYFNNIYTPTQEEYYAYYTYLNDQTLQLSFSSSINGFKPTTGSTIYFNTYTTLGSKGNFDYSGGVSMKFTNNSTYGYLDFSCETLLDGASGGKDRLDIFGQKTKILERLTTRNNIITDNDLEKFFSSVNESINLNGSTILFLKKQDDVIKRIYCNFLLLRDENNRVIPTNTAPHLKISASKLLSTNDKSSVINKNKLVIKEHSIVKCNYVRDIPNYTDLDLDPDLVIDNPEDYFDQVNNIRYSQDYIKYILDNNYFQNIIDKKLENYDIAVNTLDSIYDIMKLFEVESDELVYTIPFMISIEKEPFLRATYYNMDVNSVIAMDYKYLNNKVGASFNISNMSIEKDISPSASNKYTLESNVYKLSFNLNTNLSYDELRKNVVIKCVLANNKDDKNNNTFGHFFFKLKDVDTNTAGVVSYSYTYEAELATDYTFTDGNLNLYNCLYKHSTQSGGQSKLYQTTPIEEDIIFQIGILYYNPELAATQTIDEKGEWTYPFPEGFISAIEDPVNIIDADLGGESFKSCEDLTNQSEFSYLGITDENGYESLGYQKGYRLTDSILFLPVTKDAEGTNNNYQFYENGLFDWSQNDYANSYGYLTSFTNEHNLSDGKLTIVIKDTFPTTNTKKESNSLLLNGYAKIVIDDFVLVSKFNEETREDRYTVEIAHKLYYNEDEANYGNKNDNIFITQSYDKDGNKYIKFTIKSIIDLLRDTNTSYVKLIATDNETGEEMPLYRRQVETVDMNGQLGYTILQNVPNMNKLAVMFYNVTRTVNGETKPAVIDQLSINSAELSRTDYDKDTSVAARDDINNYVLATVISNNNTMKMYQNMSSVMSSIVTYDEENDEYDIELVPLISLRYYMARPKMIYDLLNNFITIVDNLLPRLENNTNCDIKFYNTYGPSRYFYFNKEVVSESKYIDAETNEEVDVNDINFNPYRNTIITDNTYTKYNYLGRTDVILDFTIYVYESISNEKDAEIKKYISDFVEAANDELILPISNLITSLQNTFPIIKFIKYNGIFSDKVESNNSSKNNDYQLIDNDFDFNEMSKDEIRTYVPEYLNLKKTVVKENEDAIINTSDVFDLLRYSTYDYNISINYKL